jgi:hypothetical protein
MRTTIDIPDSLFREIKSEAALRGETLKSFLLRAAKSELQGGKAGGGKRARFPIVRSKEKTYDLSPERLAEIMEEEDRELTAGH